MKYQHITANKRGGVRINSLVADMLFSREAAIELVAELNDWLEDQPTDVNGVAHLWSVRTHATQSVDKLRGQAQRFVDNGGKFPSLKEIAALALFYHHSVVSNKDYWWARDGGNLAHFLSVMDPVRAEYARSKQSPGYRVEGKDEMKKVYGIDLEG